MPIMNRTEKFIANAIKVRRTELGLNQDVSEAGGPSRTVMSLAERKGELPKSPVVRAKFAKALHWEPDACSKLEQGVIPEALAPTLSHQEIRDVIRTMRYVLDSLETRLDEEAPPRA